MSTSHDELVRRFLVPSTATLTTVLRKYGLSNTYLHQVAPLRPGTRMAGPAFTLRYIPAREDLNAGEVDNLKDAQRVAIEQVQPGQVFAIDARGETRAGTMGAILATRLHQRGAAGIVTDGAYRDSPVIAELGLPAYAAAMNAHANKTMHHPSEFQVPIACGGVAVFPGDWLVGDSEGVVVVPADLAEAVAQEALEQEEKEDFIIEKIRSGASIVGIYPPDARTLEEFARWKAGRG
ncbi:MAG: ribonuclease activity regulator RraA [Candidatus Handelsmanbacteria bacterium]|nr:ribonuclease activity regulator RraA [Candidatus Handelsmanbacteria bacterium]